MSAAYDAVADVVAGLVKLKEEPSTNIPVAGRLTTLLAALEKALDLVEEIGARARQARDLENDLKTVTEALGNLALDERGLEDVNTTTEEGGALVTALAARLTTDADAIEDATEKEREREEEYTTLQALAEHAYSLVSDLDARRPSPYPLHPMREALRALGKAVEFRID